MVAAGQTGAWIFWNLDAVRSRLEQLKQDWRHMPAFYGLRLPLVTRVEAPAVEI